jgi:cell division control protein 6
VLCTEERNTGLKLEEVRKHINDDFFVLILDEIDTLPLRERDATLYNLCNVDNIGLICIGESQFPLLTLEDRVKSRLNPQIIPFPQYATNELVGILRQRAEMGLVPDAWSHKILERIAELSEGEARIALYTLRSAANFAERDHSKFIENKHIEKGFNNIKDLKRVYALKALTEHHQILYHLIRDKREIISKELWKRYLERCKEDKLVPVAKRTFDHYLSQLVRLRLIECKRARVKGKVHLFKIACPVEA